MTHSDDGCVGPGTNRDEVTALNIAPCTLAQAATAAAPATALQRQVEVRNSVLDGLDTARRGMDAQTALISMAAACTERVA